MSDDKELIKKFSRSLLGSCFNKTPYTADIMFTDTVRSLLFYLNRTVAKQMDSGEVSVADGVSAIMAQVPAFQRDSNKWTPAMQTQYVYNVLKGFRGASISLYRLLGEPVDQCKILDGLQRITALCRFARDQDMEFTFDNGDTVTAKILLDPANDFIGSMIVLPIRVYTFNTEREAVNFYIEMNEGVTHSPEDIVKARNYLSLID